MVGTVCFNIDSLVKSQLETVIFGVAVPLIVVMKNKTQFTIARSMLKESLRELSRRHPSFYYSLETLSTFLDIDYNLLVDLYEYLSEVYVSRVDFSDDALRILKNRGVKNVVYSRSDPTIDEIKLNATGLRQYIDHVVSLPEVFGIIRGREAFEKLANHLIKHGLARSKDDILIVSTDINDYLDARDAGLKCLWFSKFGELRTGSQIFNLKEIVEFLE